MIPFFKKIRKKLADDNKPLKYIRYAIGEIVLVVIGILIALQINNNNENRIQENELNDLMKTIASGIQSDVRNLKLIRTARQDISLQMDSIFETYIINHKKMLDFNDFTFVSTGFNDLLQFINYQPNLSGFQSLKNSIYLSKLQGNDIELLLNTYYNSTERLQKIEEEHNRNIKVNYQSWSDKFRNNGMDIFLNPYGKPDSILAKFTKRFYKIINDPITFSLIIHGYDEKDFVDAYEDQIRLGEKYIEMVNQGEFNFDEQDKLDFSGILYSYSEADLLKILIKGRTPSGFDILYASSGRYFAWEKHEENYIVLSYPENTFEWGSPYFIIKQLNGRVNEMDLSKFEKILIEMKGEKGGEEFSVMMKDKNDLPDGSESRVPVTLTDKWASYEVPLHKFITADKKTITVPLGFVFLGSKGLKIHVRSVQFK